MNAKIDFLFAFQMNYTQAYLSYDNNSAHNKLEETLQRFRVCAWLEVALGDSSVGVGYSKDDAVR